MFVCHVDSRCRRADCSSPASANLVLGPNGRLIETENELFPATSDSNNQNGNNSANANQSDECTIYKFPWAVSLLWCLGIMCIALLISHCILCSSFVCRCVKKEVEEQEPSIYGDGSSIVDYDATKQSSKNKLSGTKHPYRIEYDNRDIYRTSNNYAPYCLDDDAESQEPKRRHKTTHSKRSMR